MSDFWTRRRAAVEAEETAEVAAEVARAQEVREAELAEKSDQEILAELELPEPETLQPGDDFKVFLTEAVPARIKTRALRCLWGSNPVLANIDGLVDYGEDFTDAALAVENLQTAYQVGKGMTAHVEELARQAELEAAQDNQPDVLETDQEEPAVALVVDPDPEAAEAQLAAVDQEISQETPDEDAQPATVAGRRMRFTFDNVSNPEPQAAAGPMANKVVRI